MPEVRANVEDRLTHTTFQWKELCDFLNDADPFGTCNGTSDLLEFKETKMFGTTVDSTNSQDNGEDASADDSDEPTSIGSNILFEQ